MGNYALLEHGFKRGGYFCLTVRVVLITTYASKYDLVWTF
jgi:hypothetical protein